MNYLTHIAARSSALMLLLAALFVLAPARTALAQAEGEPSERDIMVHYSLYWEDFKNANYASALPNLRWILENAPAYPRDDDRNFRRAVEAYEALAETEPTYLDSALVLFDQAVATLDEAGIEVNEQRWLVNKGRFLQTHSDHFENVQDRVAEAYREAFELDPENLGAYYVNYLISDINSRGDRAETIAFMERVEESHGDDQEVADYIERVRDTLFRSPEERMAFLESQLERRPDDVELISELFDLYMREGQRQKAHELSQRLLEAQPTARSYEMIARMRLEDGEAQEAFELYEQALEMPGAEDRQRDIFYNMGIAQQQMGRLANARTYFRRALDIDRNFGPALIGIGDLYVTAVGNCGSFEREDRAVYWLAVDYYERAASRDSSVANQARQKARSYSASFPSMEDIFFKNWNLGGSYRIDYGCYSWIGETTTIRRP
ncbi:MAG: tetratricopeptide repeat protein [Rhodothermales bacterium]